ncbi:MAG: 3'-5' exonuclease [Opitutae bacterium]|nr:3'-5' exonuclease [Opitutae bacterium]
MLEESRNTASSWTQSPIYCLDFEGSRQSGIVEYGLVRLSGGEVTELSTRLCRSTAAISHWETATHNIRDEDVADADFFVADWELFRDKRAQGPFAAHNASFENNLIKSVWPFTNLCPNFMTHSMDIDWGPWLDTCSLYRSFFPGLESYRLSELVQSFHLESLLSRWAEQWCPSRRRTFHCAPYDALASAALLGNLNNFEGAKSLTLPQLLQWSQPGGTDHARDQLELL